MSAFAGMNGGTDDALGLQLTGVDFALALATEKTSDGRGGQAQAGRPCGGSGRGAFVGVEGLTVSADALTVEMNRSFTTGRAPVR